MGRRWQKLRKGLVRLMLPPLRAWSPRAAARGLAALGKAENRLSPRNRVRHEAAVRHWAAHFGCRNWDVRQLGRELAGNEVRWQSRDLLLDGRDGDALGPLVRVHGREGLDAALAGGRGVVLLANHYGSHLVPSHWLLKQGYGLRLYMERPHHVSRFLARHLAGDDGPLGQARLLISRRSGPAESAGSILRAVKVLRAGMILCLAGDVRWSGPNTAPARFLGREQTFTATWVTLAAMTGAPVVPVFCRMTPDGRYALDFRPPFAVPPDVAARGQVPRFVQACLDDVEAQLRDDPANGNEYVRWLEAEAEADAATGVAAG
jgi:KDO2-lipid IV(A) lauroyltransferase